MKPLKRTTGVQSPFFIALSPDRRFLYSIDTESPYEDERPLLVAGTPEVREYRMRLRDKDTPTATGPMWCR